MVEVVFQPIRKIVIHEIIKNDFNSFVRMKAQQMPNMPPPYARWIDGILFDFVGVMTPTPELINERFRDGTIHWEIINFAEMPQYRQTVAHPENGTILHVMDNSSNTAVSEAIRWLKKQPAWFSKK